MSPEREWQVWEDWVNDDVLAVESEAMTPALTQALTLERIAIRRVQASDRASAVRVAFPHRFPVEEDELVPGRLPRSKLH